MLKPLDSHKPATSTTFIPHERTDVLKKLKDYEFNESDRLADNYKDIDWFGLEAISIYERAGKIIGFSSIAHRSEYFAKDECRILNRYYESIEIRRTSKVIADDHVCEMAMQQLDMARQLGFKKAFISRCRSPRHLKKFIDTVGTKTHTTWHMGDVKVAVCNPAIEECWQYKAYTDLC